MTEKTKEQEDTELVGELVTELLMRLNVEAGIPLASVLAGAHGQVVTILASVVGGEIAAERCMNAAEKVREYAPIADIALAAATPQGHA